MTERPYKCELCKGDFIATRSEEDQELEYKELFSDDERAGPLCEDCFIKVMDFNEPGKKRYEKYIDNKPCTLESYYEAWIEK